MTGVMFILRKDFGKAGLVTLCMCVPVCVCVRAHAYRGGDGEGKDSK